MKFKDMEQVTPPARPAAHEPFSWLNDELRDNLAAQFVTLTKDVAQGLKTCLEIISKSNIDREFNGGSTSCGDRTPTLNITDTGHLMQFAIASAGMLADEADRRIDIMNDAATFQAGE